MTRGCIGAFGGSVCPGIATKVGKNWCLQRVGPAKRSRRDNGGIAPRLQMVFFERGCHGRRELMAWLRRRLGAGGPRCRNQGPVG